METATWPAMSNPRNRERATPRPNDVLSSLSEVFRSGFVNCSAGDSPKMNPVASDNPKRVGQHARVGIELQAQNKIAAKLSHQYLVECDPQAICWPRLPAPVRQCRRQARAACFR